MKILFLVYILFFVLKNTVAQDSASGECQYINNWLGNEMSDDCCLDFGITCHNNHITEISLSDYQLTSSIPPEIGKLTNLKFLDLKNNQLTGSIPHEIGNLTKLEKIWLNNNKLTGSIPSEIGQLTNLKELWLHDNQLTGSIPPEIGKLTSIEWIHFDYNQLTGSIPSEIGKLSNLQTLIMNDNQLTGSIPPEIENLTNLYILRLQNNKLTGSIPYKLRKIHIFEYSGNNFTESNDSQSKTESGNPVDENPKPKSNSTGIISIVIAVVVLLLILIASIVYFKIRNNGKNDQKNIRNISSSNNIGSNGNALDRNNSIEIVINNKKSEVPVQEENIVITKNINHPNTNNTLDTPMTADITSVLTTPQIQQLPPALSTVPPLSSLVSESNKKLKKQEEAECQLQSVSKDQSISSSSHAHSTIPLNMINPPLPQSSNSKSNESHHHSTKSPNTVFPTEFEEPPPNYDEVIHKTQQPSLYSTTNPY